MRLRIIFLFSMSLFFLFFSSLSGFAETLNTPSEQFAGSYDLHGALERANQANKDIQAAEADLLGSSADSGVSRSALLPQVYTSFDARYQRSFKGDEDHSDYVGQNTKTARIGLQQALFDMPAFNRYSGAVLERERADIYLRYTRLDVLHQTERNFYIYLRARENVKSYQKAVERMQKQVQSAQAFYERQMQPRLHVLQMQTQLSKAESQLVEARNFVQTQKKQLDTLLGIPEPNQVDFIGSLSNTVIMPLEELPVYIAAAMRQRLDVTIREKDMAISQQSERVAKGGFFPRVTVSAESSLYDIDYKIDAYRDRKHEYYSVGVNARWDLFQGGQSYYSLRAQKQKTRAARLRLEKLREDVTAQVKESYLNVRQFEEQIALARTYVREAGETWERAEHGYRLGVSTSTDLVDAARSLVDAEVSLNVALADYNIARADLAFACGKSRGFLPEP